MFSVLSLSRLHGDHHREKGEVQVAELCQVEGGIIRLVSMSTCMRTHCARQRSREITERLVQANAHCARVSLCKQMMSE